MKLQQLLIGIGACLPLAFAAQGQTTTLDWKFSAAGNPSAPTASGTTNLTGGAASATFIQGNNTYFFSTPSADLYGTPRGIWAMDWVGSTEPKVQLKLDQTPESTVDLTLVVTHFTGNSLYSDTVGFSLPNEVAIGREIFVPKTGSMAGFWVADTYSWSGVSFPAWGGLNGAPITLDLFPGLNGSLLLDEVKLSILGAVSTVPEPMAGQLAGLGLALFGLRSWLRRRA